MLTLEMFQCYKNTYDTHLRTPSPIRTYKSKLTFPLILVSAYFVLSDKIK